MVKLVVTQKAIIAYSSSTAKKCQKACQKVCQKATIQSRLGRIGAPNRKNKAMIYQDRGHFLNVKKETLMTLQLLKSQSLTNYLFLSQSTKLLQILKDQFVRQSKRILLKLKLSIYLLQLTRAMIKVRHSLIQV